MKNSVHCQKLARILLSGAGIAALWGGIAQAQDQMAAATEVVVVTGSRIPRAALDSPSPVVTLTGQDMKNSGSLNVGDYVKRIPALIGSLNDADTSGYGSPSATDGSSLGGLNLLNLRNLGYIRTLVLIDGRRTVSQSTGSAAVDVNTIPITLIDRIDVDTAGDSAIYGADGVSGVVNFVMKHDLDGVRARFQAGVPEQSGGAKFLTAFSVGHNFDDERGNLTLTYEGSYQERLNFTQRKATRLGSRAFFVANPYDRGGVLNPNPGVDDPKVPDFIPVKDAGYLSSAPTGAIDVDGDGLPDYLGNGQPFIIGTEVGNFSAIGTSGMPYANVLQADFQPTTRRNIAQISSHYDFADWFKLSAEFKFAGIQTKSQSTPPFDSITIISADNAFLPPSLASVIAGNGGQAFLAEDYLAIHNQEEVKRQTYRSVIGAQGDFLSNDWISGLRYDLSYTYGQSNIDDIFENDRVADRFFAALDSVRDSNGNAVCRSSLNPTAVPPDLDAVFGVPVWSDTAPNFESSRFGESFTPGPNSGCAAFNPFGPDAASKASRDFVTQRVHTKGILTQHVVNGFLSADFKQFQDWGVTDGALSMVLGGEYRKETSKSTIDPRFSPDNLYAAVSQNVAGGFDVYEFFTEANLTVLRNRDWAQELSFNLAGRQSHYSTAGDTTTWKVSAVWAPIEMVRLRGTQAYAVRAPNIGELYSPVQLGFSSVNDPCDKVEINSGTQYRIANCQALQSALGVPYDPGITNLATGAQTQAYTGGNIALKPESARTTTGGVVFTPLDSLVITADWYNVSITRSIQALDPQTIAQQCVDLPSIVGNPYCAAVVRYGAASAFPGSIFSISGQQTNIAASATSGLDFSINYHEQLADLVGDYDSDYGDLNIHLIGNYLDKLSFTPLLGQPPVEGAGTATGGADGGIAPKWSNNLDIVWSWNSWSVDLNMDWSAAVYRSTLVNMWAQPDRYDNAYKRLPQRFVTTTQVSYMFDDGLSGYVGVENLFNAEPAIGSSNFPVSAQGRFYYVGLTADVGLGRLGL